MHNKNGSLVVVGCGLHPGHMTRESESQIRGAELVLVLVPNPLSFHQIQQLNPKLENLAPFYGNGRTFPETYAQMCARICASVRSGLQVCCVFYGHPGVFVDATHGAMRQLRGEGYSARMLPGISAEACLYADLLVDPAVAGCQSHEATSFLLSQTDWDIGASLVLWQIGLVGEHTMTRQQPGAHGLAALQKLLLQRYTPEQSLCLYEAATLPIQQPRMQWLCVHDLPGASVYAWTTMYIPPAEPRYLCEARLPWLGLCSTEAQRFCQGEVVTMQ